MRRTIQALKLPISAIVLAATLAPMASSAQESAIHCAPVQQLRIYEVPKENVDAFHARFRDHAARIMAKHGFEIRAMWQSEFDDATEFIYLLDWPDVATMRKRWATFMADEEWAAIKRETGARHGTFVNDIEDRTLCSTNYS